MMCRLLVVLLALFWTLPALAQAPGSQTELALRLLHRLSLEETTAVSPVSLQTALAMAAVGAHGATRDELVEGLVLGDDFETRLSSLWQSLADDGAQILLANRLWPARKFGLLPSYLARCQELFDAEPVALDFQQTEQARATINGWVSEATKQKIPELLQPWDLDASTLLVLTNALYFQGDWKWPFEPRQTVSRPFSTPAGSRMAPMMRQSGEFYYFEDETLQAVCLPYRDSQFAMTILLPRTHIEWATFRDTALDARLLRHALSELELGKGELEIPRFQARGRLDVIAALRSLGIEQAFGNADFSGISADGLTIGEAVHEAVVEVNESGTEAAGATAVVVTRGLRIPFRFIADRPFVFMISDSSHETILFIGQVTAPEAG